MLTRARRQFQRHNSSIGCLDPQSTKTCNWPAAYHVQRTCRQPGHLLCGPLRISLSAATGSAAIQLVGLTVRSAALGVEVMLPPQVADPIINRAAAEVLLLLPRPL